MPLIVGPTILTECELELSRAATAPSHLTPLWDERSRKLGWKEAKFGCQLPHKLGASSGGSSKAGRGISGGQNMAYFEDTYPHSISCMKHRNLEVTRRDK